MATTTTMATTTVSTDTPRQDAACDNARLLDESRTIVAGGSGTVFKLTLCPEDRWP
jgi:hypothetical protein